MWAIASRHEVGISELVQANPSIQNPALIYPGQIINIPDVDQSKPMESEVIRLVNVERAKAGLPALTANWQLSRVARYKSQDFINRNYFSHDSPTYGTPFQMITAFGIPYTAAAENIAYGQTTPASVMQGWMNSAGHRANILNRTYNQIGVGLATDSRGTPYWTQMFIRA
jgi:uncharacterized YkwD family protein